MYRPTSTNPGKNAPMNISPALVDTISNSEGIENSPVASLYIAFRAVLAISEALDN